MRNFEHTGEMTLWLSSASNPQHQPEQKVAQNLLWSLKLIQQLRHRPTPSAATTWQMSKLLRVHKGVNRGPSISLRSSNSNSHWPDLSAGVANDLAKKPPRWENPSREIWERLLQIFADGRKIHQLISCVLSQRCCSFLHYWYWMTVKV